MFAKPVNSTGSGLLKNKDVKKLRADIRKQYPAISDDILADLLPSKGGIKKLKFQAPSRVLVYENAETNEPVFFDANSRGEYYPSVYSMWRHPSILPSLLIHYPVSEFLLRGADLMLPGVRPIGDDTRREYPEFEKGEIRCIMVSGNPMPIAVGEILLSSKNAVFSGNKGKVMKIVHIFKDCLWSLGPKTIPNEGFQETAVFPIEQCTQSKPLQSTTITHTQTQSVENVESKTDETQTDDVESSSAENGSMTPDEMDYLLELSFLQAIKKQLKDKDLPILTSTFYSTMMLPSRPAGSQLHIKRSSYKKLSFFLQQMASRGMIQTSEKDDGIQLIVSVNRSASDIRAFKSFKTEAEAESEQMEQEGGFDQLDFTPGEYAPQVLQLLKAPSRMNEMFKKYNKENKTYLTYAEVKGFMMKYIADHELDDPSYRQFMILDGNLTDELFKGKKKPAGGYPEILEKAEAAEMLYDRCQKFHVVKLHPNHKPKVSRGELKNIEIHVERRMGNKKMTSVARIEQFGLDPETFAKDAQRQFASSTTTGQSIHNVHITEVCIQGDCTVEVENYLTKHYKIPAKYITTTHAKGLKKKKK